MVFIYVLQLEKGKYYIGKTNNPKVRIDNHFSSNGSNWTYIYKPINVHEVIPDCDDYDEDKITKKYMDKYGIDNVRGGSFSSVELDKSTISVLEKMKNGTNDLCFKCGKSGHFANNCDYELIYACKFCRNHFKSEKICENHEKKCDKNNTKCDCPASYFSSHRKIKCFINNELLKDTQCFRCGRDGHLSYDCYSKKHIDGYYLK
jgi:GIY-YIG catalytic domain/Zinc knuckle